jgi:hypothetical protein
MYISHHRRINKSRMLGFLDDIENPTAQSYSLYLTPGLSVPEIEDLIKDLALDKEIATEITELVTNSSTGGVLFWGNVNKCLAIPPFPLQTRITSKGYDVEPFRSLLQQQLLVALILVRLGEYAIGVFEGEKLLSSKVGTGLVHSRHKKGGSSQRRFERHREKQMEGFFTRVCAHVRSNLEPHARQLSHVIYGGERNTLQAFRKQCRFLSAFDDLTMGLRLNVRKPRQPMLEAAIIEVWSSELIEWVEAS